MKRTATILMTLMLLTPLAWAEGKGNGKGRQRCNLNTLLMELPEETLDATEAAGLAFMREEEKLARDVYLSLYETWGLRAFRKIARAERNHMGATLVLLRKYGREDPVGENGLGVFTNPALQNLYSELVAAGNDSLMAAVIVGLTVEDIDIADLQQRWNLADNQDLRALYQNLMQGSRNHLRAFAGVLDRLEGIYEPIRLSQAEYEEILSSPKERGLLDGEGSLICGGGKREQDRGDSGKCGSNGRCGGGQGSGGKKD